MSILSSVGNLKSIIELERNQFLVEFGYIIKPSLPYSVRIYITFSRFSLYKRRQIYRVYV
ncbi:hypothetical protein NC653_030316 [Populus alba x Populus x berolinensis]|uniref:Uncharacterized protein n=1 Tax=Populus alba x Populus x berolinensis TaxID=444605 RepID=A0AAD6LVR5_9ROSI|nr:hypothetical protein NC653_030316 [Populus alba x Populus x berolinensis]